MSRWYTRPELTSKSKNFSEDLIINHIGRKSLKTLHLDWRPSIPNEKRGVLQAERNSYSDGLRLGIKWRWPLVGIIPFVLSSWVRLETNSREPWFYTRHAKPIAIKGRCRRSLKNVRSLGPAPIKQDG